VLVVAGTVVVDAVTMGAGVEVETTEVVGVSEKKEAPLPHAAIVSVAAVITALRKNMGAMLPDRNIESSALVVIHVSFSHSTLCVT
jgi:hypothetical protein